MKEFDYRESYQDYNLCCMFCPQNHSPNDREWCRASPIKHKECINIEPGFDLNVTSTMKVSHFTLTSQRLLKYKQLSVLYVHVLRAAY